SDLDIDSIVVLGAKVNEKHQISLMLKDRLDKGIELLKLGISDTLLMSGDGVNAVGSETKAMLNYANVTGIDNDRLKEDRDGLSTSNSMYGLKYKFNYKKVVIVTQEYHLYRALYIANEIGIDAYGVKAKDKKYKGSWYRELREVLARCKDFIMIRI
ncbi:MAG: YdcF family protein, partial [Romboutsia sp.]|nr:YdcF family protein [Romboutsia sp.]